MLAVTVSAQSTARHFTLKNSADGESELTVYLPAEEALKKSNGRIIVDCPGGGYSHLAMQHEGHDWAKFYNEQGIALAVLKYRMPKGDRNIPLSDAYNAIRTVRDSASVARKPQQRRHSRIFCRRTLSQRSIHTRTTVRSS